MCSDRHTGPSPRGERRMIRSGGAQAGDAPAGPCHARHPRPRELALREVISQILHGRTNSLLIVQFVTSSFHGRRLFARASRLYAKKVP